MGLGTAAVRSLELGVKHSGRALKQSPPHSLTCPRLCVACITRTVARATVARIDRFSRGTGAHHVRLEKNAFKKQLVAMHDVHHGGLYPRRGFGSTKDIVFAIH